METILLLIAKYGIPLAQQIYTTVSTKIVDGKPTPGMWAELQALENNSAAEFKTAIENGR